MENDESEPYYMRMTPLEADIQLQCSELIFRATLEGQRPPISDHEDMQSWEKSVLGDAWCKVNTEMRREIQKQVRQAGEDTPAWMECLAHMGDISWEVLEAGKVGERMRPIDKIDRTEILEQFKDLKVKVALSHYGRCGAGDKLFGFRACVAIFRTFIRDPEVLKIMLQTLTYVITVDDQNTLFEYNRDSLCCMTVPAPPLERSQTDKDRGWSFLRNSLNAFVVQAGGVGYGETGDEEHEPGCTSPEVALDIAKLIILTKDAPAVLVQIVICHEEVPEGAWHEREELRDIVPLALQKLEDMEKALPNEMTVWDEFRTVIAKGPYEHLATRPKDAASSSQS